MRNTPLLLASILLLYTTPAKPQAAAEAGMATGAIANITTATSHKLSASNLASKTGGKVTEVTNTTRTTPKHSRTTTAQKKSTTASTATHSTKPQSHIVSVWPPNALIQTQ